MMESLYGYIRVKYMREPVPAIAPLCHVFPYIRRAHMLCYISFTNGNLLAP